MSKLKLYKIVLSENNSIIAWGEDAIAILQEFYTTLKIKQPRIYILSFWDFIKYIFKGDKTMIRSYGVKYRHDFPNPDVILQTLGNDDVAVIKEIGTEYNYILTRQLRYWTQISELASIAAEDAEWVMTIDDFENGWGDREYPHCSNCKRGVYRHDAGSWCPFCGKSMKNPMIH